MTESVLARMMENFEGLGVVGGMAGNVAVIVFVGVCVVISVCGFLFVDVVACVEVFICALVVGVVCSGVGSVVVACLDVGGKGAD